MKPSAFGRFLLVLVLTFSLTTSGVARAATASPPPKPNYSDLAKLIAAGSYVAGFAFAVGAVVRFKAHKDNPTQNPVSQAIVFLFVAAALIFAPSIFKTAGGTIFGGDGEVPGVEGLTEFDFAVGSAAITGKLLEQELTAESKTALRDSLQFLMAPPGKRRGGLTAEQRSHAVMAGALVGLKERANKLSSAQRGELLELIGRASVSGLDEAGTAPARIAPHVEFLLGETIALLDDLGFSRPEQAEYAARLLEGAVRGLNGTGLTTAQRLDALDDLSRRAVRSLRMTDVAPEDLDRAVSSLVAGALKGLAGSELSGPQYVVAAKGIAAGTLEGISDFLEPRALTSHEKKNRAIAALREESEEKNEQAWLKSTAAVREALDSFREELDRQGEGAAARGLGAAVRDFSAQRRPR